MVSVLRALALTGGDWVIYALLLCSLAAVAIIFERFFALRREDQGFRALRQAVMAGLGEDLPSLEKTVQRHPGAAGRILKTALARSHHGPEGVEDLLIAASLAEKEGLEKWLLVLGTLGSNAPFIGLFGTVLGVIRAFHDLAQTTGGPEVVMQGLSEALVATAVGLFVAIPCVIAYNYFSKNVKDLLGGTESLGRYLMAHIREGRAKR
ncbi:MAG: MotA/TolQ/ExbB proton channel family protein [Elusimicrobia bacterium]|nr:MotA/TolQ/ExbB proton channel family protein [Elusimicrobiota bacterium]